MSQTPNKIEKRPPKPKPLGHAVPKTVAGRDAKAPAYETAAVAEPKTEIVRGMGSLLDSESVRPIGARKFTPRKTAVPSGSAFLRAQPLADASARCAQELGEIPCPSQESPSPASQEGCLASQEGCLASQEGCLASQEGCLASQENASLASQEGSLASQEGSLASQENASLASQENASLASHGAQGDSRGELTAPTPITATRPAGQSCAANDRMAKAMVGMALLYAARFEEHVWGPIRFLGKHCLPVAFALLHLCMPFAIAWLAAGANEEMRQTFLAGGVFANLGKLVWLFVASVFVWSLAWIGLNRAWRALRDDVSQYERIGRGFFSPNSEEWDSAKRKR